LAEAIFFSDKLTHCKSLFIIASKNADAGFSKKVATSLKQSAARAKILKSALTHEVSATSSKTGQAVTPYYLVVNTTF
jgi:hypothetical protein